MAKRQRENKEEKKVAAQPLHHACQVCHNHTKGCTVDLQYMWTFQWMKPSVITSEDDIISTDNETKRQKQRRREDSTTHG